MSLEKEWEKERIHHKYGSIWLALSSVGILALIALTVTLVKYHRPLYDTFDVILMVTVGVLLGAVYMESSQRLGKNYKRELAETDEKSARAQPNPKQETKAHDGKFEETHA